MYRSFAGIIPVIVALLSLLCAPVQTDIASSPNLNALNHRSPSGLNTRGEVTTPPQFKGEVSFTDLTSGDLSRTDYDNDGIWYIGKALSLYLDRKSKSIRTGVFWAGGATTEDDFDIVDEFLEINLNSEAQKADLVFPYSDFTDMNLDRSNRNHLWWRAINRMSKALAAGATNDVAYVYLKNTNCRTLFSPPSQNPQDNDPSAGGAATNGEIFYYAELPMLMRNTNIKQIKTFSKVNRKFVVNTEWDVDVDTDKPRDFLPDITMDATPIILPQAAGQGPLKRNVALSQSATTMGTDTGSSNPGIASSTAPYPISSGFRTLPSGSLSSGSGTGKLASGTGGGTKPSGTGFSGTGVSTRPSGTGFTGTGRSITVSSGSASGHSSSGLPPSSSGVGNSSVASSATNSLSSSTGSQPSHNIGTYSISSGATLTPTSNQSPTSMQGSPSSTATSAGQTTSGSASVPNTKGAGSTLLVSQVSVTASTTLIPTGAIASSSAHALQSQIVVIGPQIQNYIDTASKQGAQDTINALQKLLPEAQEFSDSIGPGSNPEPCGISANPITDIFNAGTCLVQGLNDAVKDIEPGLNGDFSSLNQVKSDLAYLNALQIPLENDTEEDDEDDDDDNNSSSQTASSTKTSSTSASSTASSSASCTNMHTISNCQVSCPTGSSSASCSTTCPSTFSGCSATGTTSTISSSAAACAYNPSQGVSSNTIPLSSFTEVAWWDYGISCAGSCTDFSKPVASITPNGGSTSSGTAAGGGASVTTGPSATTAPLTTSPSTASPSTASRSSISPSTKSLSMISSPSKTTPSPRETPVSTTATSSSKPPTPPPVCKAGFYGTDTTCGGKCNGGSASCDCVMSGYLVQVEACTCTC